MNNPAGDKPVAAEARVELVKDTLNLADLEVRKRSLSCGFLFWEVVYGLPYLGPQSADTPAYLLPVNSTHVMR